MTEVNFWQPSGAREFRVLAPGEPFFFKTHYPHNRLVGGGFFSDSARLRVSEAWEFFGEANGVASIEEMRARIGRYRRTPISADEDPVIGCLFVRDVRFFPDDAHCGSAAAIRPERRAGQKLRPGRSGSGGVLRGHTAVDSRRRGGTGFQPALAPAGAGVRRPAAGAVPARPAVLQGGRPGLVPPALRHQRHAHPAGPAGGPHPAGRQGRGAPARQRAAAQVRYPHPVRPRIPRRGPAAPPARKPASARGLQQRRPVLRQGKARSSTYRNAGPTGPGESSWNGTSRRSSSRQPQPEWSGARYTFYVRPGFVLSSSSSLSSRARSVYRVVTISPFGSGIRACHQPSPAPMTTPGWRWRNSPRRHS